jgi:hypothetical protein
MCPGGGGWQQRHPDISDRKRHRVCSELLVLGDGIARSAAAETGHLRKGADLGEGRTLVGTHRCTSFRQHPAPRSLPVRVRDRTAYYPTPYRANTKGRREPPDCIKPPGQWGGICSSLILRRWPFREPWCGSVTARNRRGSFQCRPAGRRRRPGGGQIEGAGQCAVERDGGREAARGHKARPAR